MLNVVSVLLLIFALIHSAKVGGVLSKSGMEARFLTYLAVGQNLKICSVVSFGWPQREQKSGKWVPLFLRLLEVGSPLLRIFQIKNLILV